MFLKKKVLQIKTIPIGTLLTPLQIWRILPFDQEDRILVALEMLGWNNRWRVTTDVFIAIHPCILWIATNPVFSQTSTGLGTHYLGEQWIEDI